MRGGQWQAFHLMRGQIAAGHRVRLLAPSASSLFEAALAQKIDVRPLHLRTLHVASSGVDVIHVHDARSHTIALFTQKPVVVSRRVAFPVHRGLASRWKYHRAAHYLAVSEFVKATLLNAGIQESKITVVYDGVSVDGWPENAERSRVLALDSDDPGKGKTILEQASALADIPVHFSENLVRDLPDAAVFVYITELEGLGSAVLLAMAAGTPVLASCVGGLPEVVEDGVTGLLTSNDPQSIARQIQHLLADHTLASQLAARARTRVKNKFSLDRMVKETLQVYERVLD